MILDNLDGLELLREHGIRVPSDNERTKAIAGGTDIVIECKDDPVQGRIVEIRSGTHHAHRLAPIDEFQAEAMLSDFGAKHGIASNEKETRMLAHLLLRASAVFSEDAIEGVLLDPVRLHHGAYDVLGAKIEASRAVTLNRRLDPHAHDRKGLPFRANGRMER